MLSRLGTRWRQQLSSESPDLPTLCQSPVQLSLATIFSRHAQDLSLVKTSRESSIKIGNKDVGVLPQLCDFHLQMVFMHNARRVVNYYITRTRKKSNQVPVYQFFKHVNQLNSYLDIQSYLYYSPKANSATKL